MTDRDERALAMCEANAKIIADALGLDAPKFLRLSNSEPSRTTLAFDAVSDFIAAVATQAGAVRDNAEPLLDVVKRSSLEEIESLPYVGKALAAKIKAKVDDDGDSLRGE